MPDIEGLDNSGADVIPDHAQEFEGNRKVKRRLARNALGKFTKGRMGVYTCVVPGVSLSDYSRNAEGKGWGPPCKQDRTTITLSNGVRLTVASRIAELTNLILNECLKRGYKIRQLDTGAYNCRFISGTTRWSNHAWALAADINWQLNPMRKPLTTNIPVWMRQLFNRYGFAWGGDYRGTPDAMHFEFMGTPGQADAATVIARRELAPGGSGGGGGGGGTGSWRPSVTAAPGARTVRLWDVGPNDVRYLQRWHGLEDDGKFGPQTEAKVKDTQKRNGLTADGVCGPRTWAKVLAR